MDPVFYLNGYLLTGVNTAKKHFHHFLISQNEPFLSKYTQIMHSVN